MIKSLAIYFFYDEASIVDEYVFYYLKCLSPCFDEICFVSNSNLDSKVISRISTYCRKVIIRDNKGFDAWAYKQALELYGFDFIKQLDKLLLNNFTCYGPIYPFANMFEKMSNINCDFWGHCEYRTKTPTVINGIVIPPHLMSYFICFNHSLLSSDDFKIYWDNLPEIKNYWDSVTLHESKLTMFFYSRGYKYFSYIQLENYNLESSGNLPVNDAYSLLLLDMNPLLKRKVFEYDYKKNRWKWKQASKVDQLEILSFINKYTKYPVELILQNLKRTYLNKVANLINKINSN